MNRETLEAIELAARRASANLTDENLSLVMELFADELARIIQEHKERWGHD